ncbi:MULTISPECIES: gliding motility protein GldL [Myroides]|jgi:gliding motility-associated protein GldL|uniref:Gliding motility-associated protein GldL n=1 Tax=Myroides odoratus TaxID=256 RepID=A0A378U2M5_MYROD|nr:MULTISPECIES: gliding motility protein GldL [Myroides]MDH6602693.1 gliding motility-associated protein GldL [Myroides gitamensis]MCS4238868.1 gliding motility-associated protein GldL [Myroides odoratus]MDR0224357.1 gliding motility protein GldL [Myroides odoratus]QQU03805.1 gliding motility protein GldL [Myroides odoratus]WHT37884.1 gliding motility protein GldL [Myroides sp. mNGS23_01]
MAIPKKVMNFCYGMGASVVIIGALFKITHMELGPINGNNMLTLGLVVEALIFAISAFEPVDDELDWSKVYPELKGGEPTQVRGGGSAVGFVGGGTTEEQGMLSKKLDDLLKEAKIDGELMNSLSKSIRNFEAASKEIAPTVDSVASTRKYAEEMSMAAAQLESLNSMYKVQLESATRNAEINKEVAENNIKLKEQMSALTSNLSSLNTVYGGMLSAMGNRGAN